ncbi:unnamed protein product [Spirodela intermedia]|uniref:Uncharacterized protein n=2 Tax=Spirodela intermedia TaxID=51605 RepID=A0A7I8IVP8_SPIIN|nr:unnamed protein product [Spirodela intermedia]CAA6661653.1 unnamed protein product [Spirodela intermedia]CAA7398026.1 unnamed protein product [Spirodela intermedia]
MYQRLIRRLIYPISLLSQFMHQPTKSHLYAAYQVLHYLKGTPGKDILFKRGDKLTVEMYTDANYAGSLLDRQSTSGLMMFMRGNLVTWRSKKHNVVARSSPEVEFRALVHEICELLWVKILLTNLKIPISCPMKLYCDNKSAINLEHNLIQHAYYCKDMKTF